MKKYTHPTDTRMRIMGYSTQDTDLSVGTFCETGYAIPGESTHIHTESSETYIVFEGRGTLWVDGRVYGIRPGTTYKVEAGEPHRMLTASKPPLRGISIKVPDDTNDKVDVKSPPELRELIRKHGLIE